MRSEAEALNLLSAAEADGTADATVLVVDKKALFVMLGLRPQRYELVRTFITLHFGRSDLIGHIRSHFVGWAASSEAGRIIPTYNEFLEGRPYLMLDDSPIRFSAKSRHHDERGVS